MFFSISGTRKFLNFEFIKICIQQTMYVAQSEFVEHFFLWFLYSLKKYFLLNASG